MNIVTIGRGSIGQRPRHYSGPPPATTSPCSAATAVMPAMRTSLSLLFPGTAIAEALGEVEGVTGKTATDATNTHTEQAGRFASLSEEIQSFTQAPVAKSFNLKSSRCNRPSRTWSARLAPAIAGVRTKSSWCTPANAGCAADHRVRSRDPTPSDRQFYNSLLRDKFLEPRRSSQTTEIR
jgi:hypothetical protein